MPDGRSLILLLKCEPQLYSVGLLQSMVGVGVGGVSYNRIHP